MASCSRINPEHQDHSIQANKAINCERTRAENFVTLGDKVCLNRATMTSDSWVAYQHVAADRWRIAPSRYDTLSAQQGLLGCPVFMLTDNDRQVAIAAPQRDVDQWLNEYHGQLSLAYGHEHTLRVCLLCNIRSG